MEALYSYKGQYPQPRPDRIRLSSGYTRTDKNTFTEEELDDAGYIRVPDAPEFDSKTEKLIFENNSWLVVPLTDAEIIAYNNTIWQPIREKRNKLIEEVMWRIQRYESEQRLNLITTDDINELDLYVQALRDITKQEDPYNLIWPIPPEGITSSTN